MCSHPQPNLLHSVIRIPQVPHTCVGEIKTQDQSVWSIEFLKHRTSNRTGIGVHRAPPYPRGSAITVSEFLRWCPRQRDGALGALICQVARLEHVGFWGMAPQSHVHGQARARLAQPRVTFKASLAITVSMGTAV